MIEGLRVFTKYSRVTYQGKPVFTEFLRVIHLGKTMSTWTAGVLMDATGEQERLNIQEQHIRVGAFTAVIAAVRRYSREQPKHIDVSMSSSCYRCQLQRSLSLR